MYLVGLHTATDKQIWEYAEKHRFTIVSQDTDFYEKPLVWGFPPKVIWLRTGNTTANNIWKILTVHKQKILEFEKDISLGCLTIYD